MRTGKEGLAGSLKTGAWPGSKRRRAEQALAQEHDFAEAVLDSLPGIFYCYDEALRFVRWNKNFERVSGYSAAEIAGMSPLDFFAGADRELIRARIAEVFARGESDAEAEFVARDGTRTPYYFTGRATLIGGKRHLVGVGIDLRERKQSEAALREAHDRLAKVVATTPGVVCSFRLRPDGSACFPFGGDRVAEMAGLSPGTLAEDASAFFAVVHPDDLAGLRESIAESARRLSPWRYEWRVRHRLRGELWIEARSMPAREPDGSTLWHGVATDVTDRKRAEAALRESEARLRLSVAAADVGLWDWDLTTNKVYFSPEWKRQIGYRDDEISNELSEWQSRVHPDDLEPTLAKVRAFLADPVGRHEVEFRFRHKDGTYRWIYAHGDVLRDAAGKPVRMLGCHIDITERKQGEEALRALTARLLDVREEERAGIARELHDQLGQALTGLKLDLAWLERRLTEPSLRAKTEQMVATIDDAVQMVRRISSELRPGVLDNLGLATAIEWQAAEFEQRTGIRCAVSVPEQAPKLEAARATAVFRIFQEALTNVARHAGASRVQIRLRQVGGQMELAIADNGRGISDVECAAQSLGLLGMRERAAAVGGRLAITGAPGQGTTLRVTVPISEP